MRTLRPRKGSHQPWDSILLAFPLHVADSHKPPQLAESKFSSAQFQGEWSVFLFLSFFFFSPVALGLELRTTP
jgi:hypothetical protein